MTSLFCTQKEIRRHRFGVLALLISGVLLVSACKTTNPESESASEPLPPPPEITSTMPLEQALQVAIDYGGDVATDVRKLVKRRKEAAKAGELLHIAIEDSVTRYRPNQLVNAVQLYTVMPVAKPEELFKVLLASGRPLARQLAWQLAAARPNKRMATAMEAELSRALREGDEDSILLPQMAMALRANRLTGAYTYARQGLMTKGHEAFAEAMIALDRERASDDLMTYLAIAPSEELRQLTLTSVNIYACVAALKHMINHPATISHPNIDHLFYFAVSRNTALAELAQTVIENYLPSGTDQLAMQLSRLPVWTQIAYLEATRRNMKPKLGLLLGELRRVSSQEDVLEELNEVR